MGQACTCCLQRPDRPLTDPTQPTSSSIELSQHDSAISTSTTPTNSRTETFKKLYSESDLSDAICIAPEHVNYIPNAQTTLQQFIQMQQQFTDFKKFSTPLTICLTGPGACGKTALFNRLIYGTFERGTQKQTIGMDFGTITLEVSGKSVNLRIWDLGSSVFKTITNNYYRAAHGVVMTFNIFSRESFDELHQIKEDIEKHGSEDLQYMVIGHHMQTDKNQQREVSSEEAIEFANKFSTPAFYFELDADSSPHSGIKFPFMMFIDKLTDAVVTKVSK